MTMPPRAHESARRAPAGSLALGAYAMLLGTVFYVPFMLSALAQQNDVFMTNLFLGLAYVLLGSTLTIVAICQIAALRPWLIAGAAILNGALLLVGIASLLSADGYAMLAPILAAYTAILLALSLLAAARRSQLAAWSRALLLALAGAGLITLSYVFLGGRYHDAYGIATYLPRYLDGTTSGLSLLLGVAVYVLGRGWAGRV